MVTVDKTAQRLSVAVDGFPRYEWPVSTARWGYRTPNGSYRPQWLARKWFSRKYDWSPMPYSIFFDGGYAIHGSYEISHLGRPASHGCIRLHPDNAAILFALVQDVHEGHPDRRHRRSGRNRSRKCAGGIAASGPPSATNCTRRSRPGRCVAVSSASSIRRQTRTEAAARIGSTDSRSWPDRREARVRAEVPAIHDEGRLPRIFSSCLCPRGGHSDFLE